MKRIFLFSAIVLAAVTQSYGQNKTKLSLSLEQAISTALVNNYGQQILEISTESSEEDLQQSKRDRLPNLSASLSQGVSNQNSNGSYNLNAQATIWSGGQVSNIIRRNQLALNQSETKVAQAQNELTINVIQAFLTLMMNDELYKYQIEVAKVSHEQMKQGEIKYKSQLILESDYLLLKAQYASDSYALVNSKANRENAILELKTLLSLDSQTDIEIVTPTTDIAPEKINIPTLQQLIDETLAWLPDIKIASQNIDIAQIETKIAKGALTPTLSLGGSVGSGYQSGGSSWSKQFSNGLTEQLSLSLSIPLWNRGKTKSNVRLSELRTRQAELEAKQTELSVRSQLEKEYRNVVSLREKYIASMESNNAYKEAFKVFSLQFTSGAISTTELLQQQNSYLTALNNYLQSKYSFLLNRKVLDVYMGSEIKF